MMEWGEIIRLGLAILVGVLVARIPAWLDSRKHKLITVRNLITEIWINLEFAEHNYRIANAIINNVRGYNSLLHYSDKALKDILVSKVKLTIDFRKMLVEYYFQICHLNRIINMISDHRQEAIQERSRREEMIDQETIENEIESSLQQDLPLSIVIERVLNRGTSQISYKELANIFLKYCAKDGVFVHASIVNQMSAISKYISAHGLVLWDRSLKDHLPKKEYFTNEMPRKTKH